MPTTNQGLLDAYNALFSNTPFGAAIRRRVLGGMQQSRRITGSGTRGGSSMPRGTGGEDTEPNMMGGRDRSGPPDYSTPNTAVNTSSGALPGSTPPSIGNASGPSSSSGGPYSYGGVPAGSYSPTSPGLAFSPSYNTNNPFSSMMAGWNTPTAIKSEGYTRKPAMFATGPILGYVQGILARAGGALAAGKPYSTDRTGLNVGRFDRSRTGWGGPNFGGFSPHGYGVIGGQAGYFGGSPDDRMGPTDPYGGGGYGEGGYGDGGYGGAADPGSGRGGGPENY